MTSFALKRFGVARVDLPDPRSYEAVEALIAPSPAVQAARDRFGATDFFGIQDFSINTNGRRTKSCAAVYRSIENEIRVEAVATNAFLVHRVRDQHLGTKNLPVQDAECRAEVKYEERLHAEFNAYATTFLNEHQGDIAVLRDILNDAEATAPSIKEYSLASSWKELL